MSEEYEDVDVPEQIAVRMQKREQLLKHSAAYPVSLPITNTIEATKAHYPNLEADIATGDVVGHACATTAAVVSSSWPPAMPSASEAWLLIGSIFTSKWP